jgi:hypothetical protein
MQMWSAPSVALLRGTALGLAPQPSNGQQRFPVQDGRLIPILRGAWTSVQLQEEVDALLYLGPSAEGKTKAPPLSVCSEPGCIERRLARMNLAGLPPPELERLRKLCAK